MNVVQVAVFKSIPKKCKKAKCLSDESLQIAEKRKDRKTKEKNILIIFKIWPYHNGFFLFLINFVSMCHWFVFLDNQLLDLFLNSDLFPCCFLCRVLFSLCYFYLLKYHSFFFKFTILKWMFHLWIFPFFHCNKHICYYELSFECSFASVL